MSIKLGLTNACVVALVLYVFAHILCSCLRCSSDTNSITTMSLNGGSAATPPNALYLLVLLLRSAAVVHCLGKFSAH